MAGKIKATTVLRNPKSGSIEVLLEGSVAPSWAVKLIKNPEVLAQGPAAKAEAESEAKEKVDAQAEAAAEAKATADAEAQVKAQEEADAKAQAEATAKTAEAADDSKPTKNK